MFLRKTDIFKKNNWFYVFKRHRKYRLELVKLEVILIWRSNCTNWANKVQFARIFDLSLQIIISGRNDDDDDDDDDDNDL